MNTSRTWSLAVMIMAVVVLMIPWVIFPVCGVGRYAPALGIAPRMHGCTATFKAVTLLGVLGFLVGLWPLIMPKRPVILASAILATCLGILVILFPTMITGMCMMSTMPCVFGTKPALLVVGFLMTMLGLIGMVLSRKVP